jgi:hypothetical protein
MRKTAFLSMLFAAACMAQSGTMKSRDGGCQVSVPPDWKTDDGFGITQSPDKKYSAAVSSPKMIDSFSALKQNARTVYQESKVTKDSATEFEMEGKSIAGKPDVYRAIPIAGNKFCIVDVTYSGGSLEEARKIAASLKAAK